MTTLFGTQYLEWRGLGRVKLDAYASAQLRDRIVAEATNSAPVMTLRHGRAAAWVKEQNR